MNSEILNAIGLGNLDPAIFIIVILLIAIVAVIIAIISTNKLKKMSMRIDSFMKGKHADSLEDIIAAIVEDNKNLTAYVEQNKKDIRRINKNLEIAYQKVGVVRYNAFKENGGQLSFSLCMLNDRNNGYIINSVHSTNGCYVYCKEIEGGICKINLGDEEQQALEIAMMGGKN
ncbi:MAG: DUF4446 family protein [Lachnospiraceae bacterium]|nr:DUF4446 family protein [Candidatus Merdinaster equi]